MEDIKETCFICGTELSEEDNGKCSNCGYEYSIKDICPRLNGKVCIHTNDFCTKGENYFGCPVLLKYD